MGGARPDRRAVRRRLRGVHPAARRARPAVRGRSRRAGRTSPARSSRGCAAAPPARTSKPKFRIDAANALIADVPEIRDKVALQSLAVSRLGKDVVDLLDASVVRRRRAREVLHEVEWRIAPGERTGILGVNGAGKSTLLGLVSGDVDADRRDASSAARRCKVATLTQRLDELEDHLDDPVRVVISRLRTTYEFGIGSKAQELTPGQLLERHGLRERAALDAGEGPLRRAEAPPAAAADPARAAQRADPRRADERPRHRHARRDGGPPRLVAGHAHRRLARPVLPRAGHRSAVRDPLAGGCGTFRAASTSTCGCGRASATTPAAAAPAAASAARADARARRRRAARRAEGARRARAAAREARGADRGRAHGARRPRSGATTSGSAPR